LLLSNPYLALTNKMSLAMRPTQSTLLVKLKHKK